MLEAPTRIFVNERSILQNGPSETSNNGFCTLNVSRQKVCERVLEKTTAIESKKTEEAVRPFSETTATTTFV